MPNLGTISVDLSAATQQFQKNLQAASASLSRFSEGASAMARGAGAAFAGMVGGLAVATMAASKQREAELKLGAAIQASGKAIDPQPIKDYAAALQKVTTYGDEVTINAASMLATFQLEQDQIMALLPQVQNFAAVHKMDLATAASLVGKTYTMGISALTRYGVSLDDAQKKAFKLADQQSKTAMLVDALNSRYAGMAQTMAGTAGGAFQQMTNQIGDLAEQIGFIVEGPIIQGLRGITGLFSKLTSFVSNLSKGTKDFVGRLALLVTGFTGLTAAVAGFVALAPIVATFAAPLIPLIPITLAIAAAIAGIILLVGALKMAWDGDLGNMATTAKGTAKEIKGSFTNMFGDLLAKAKKTLGWLSEKLITIYGFVSGASAEETGLMLQESQKTDAGMLGQVAAGSAEDAKEIASAVSDLLQTSAGGIRKSFVKGFDTIFGGLADVLKDTIPDLSELTTTIEANTVQTAQVSKKVLEAAEGTWEDYSKANKVAKETTSASSGIFDTLKTFGMNLVQNMGLAGEVIMNAIQGAQVGGIWGAIAAVLITLLSKARGFMLVVEMINDQLGGIIRLLDVVLKPIFSIIMLLMIGISNIWNGIVSAITWVFKKISGWLSAWGISTKGLDRITNELAKTRMDTGKYVDNLKKLWEGTGDALADAEQPVNDFADTMRSASASLSNVPEGFKSALARFNAIDANQGTFSPNAGGVGGKARTVIVNIAEIKSNDPAQFLADMESEAEWQNVENGGSLISASPQYVGG